MDPAALKANPLSGHLCVSLFTFLFLKVETMDKENENAALEETVGMIVANVIRGATEQFLDLQKKGKGSVLALFAMS